MHTSSFLGVVGTVLAAIAAGLTDFHAVAVPGDISVALTAIVGWLVGHHILAGSTAEKAKTDALSVVTRMADVVHAAVTAARAPASVPTATATTVTNPSTPAG